MTNNDIIKEINKIRDRVDALKDYVGIDSKNYFDLCRIETSAHMIIERLIEHKK